MRECQSVLESEKFESFSGGVCSRWELEVLVPGGFFLSGRLEEVLCLS